MKRLMIAAALVLLFAQPLFADWQAGQNAADRGEMDTAIKEWLIAASEGNAKAQYSMGYQYQSGDGVPRDLKKAVEFFRMAAEQGHSGAQLALGNLCRMGLGMKENRILALMWYKIAAGAGHPMARRSVDRIAVNMTAEEVDEAGRLVQAWHDARP